MRKVIIVAALPLILLASLVGAASPPGKWVEVRSENFIVVSNAGEIQARETAIQFEQVRALFRDSMPSVKGHPSPLVTVFAVKDENSLQGLLPEMWADKKHLRPAGIFVNRFDLFQVAVNVNAEGDNPYSAIYHEYYHAVTLPYMPGIPAWVAEGMAEFWGNSYIEGRQAEAGFPSKNHLAQLRQAQLLPLDQLFKIDHNSPYYNEQDKASIFYAESWALVHYFMFADRGAHRDAIGNYLAALREGARQDQAAAMAFGDLAKLQRNLESYVSLATYSAFVLPPPARPAEADIHFRSLSPAEVSAYFGGFLVLNNQVKAAEPLLNEAAQLDPKLALAQENLALLHYSRKERAEAEAALSAAIALDPDNATTRYLRAEIAYQAPPRNYPQIEEDLRKALAAKPELAAADSLLSFVLSAEGASLSDALAFADKAVSLEPGNFTFRLALGWSLARVGRLDDAETQARSLQNSAPDTVLRDQADQLLAYVARLRAANNIPIRSGRGAAAAPDSSVAPPRQTVPDSK